MNSEISRNEIAKKYFVNNLPSASLVGSRLSNILESLEVKKPLSSNSLDYLEINKFKALHELALGITTYAEFSTVAKLELVARELELKAEEQRQEIARKKADEERDVASKLVQEKIIAANLAFAKDPRNIAKAKQKALRQKYDIEGFIEQTHFAKLMVILQRIDAGNRLLEEEIIWLQIKAKEYYTPEVKHRHHENEAKFYAGEFSKTKDAWSAVNASSHYRKCDAVSTADIMLSSIDVGSKSDLKLKSALYTTHGGVKRDLMRWDDAIGLAEKAHQITPKDFRPCTLMGAVHMEMGNYDLGQIWYEKAEERGAELKSIDSELRSIFFRADKIKQDALRTHLLSIDVVRYSWAKK
ncbi:MAG: hypothetical protein ABL880_11595 [Methylotenera sp.]